MGSLPSKSCAAIVVGLAWFIGAVPFIPQAAAEKSKAKRAADALRGEAAINPRHEDDGNEP